MRDFLFACGCPRSGTTALWRLLAADDRIRMGVERYGNRFFTRDFLSPGHFEKKRFFDLQPGDTFYSDLTAFNPYYQHAQDGYDDALYFGDKIPRLYEYFDRLKANFDAFKVIMIVRNVFDMAASYKARQADPGDNWQMGVSEAIQDWNTSLVRALEAQRDLNILFLDFENLFGAGTGLGALYDFLGLEVTPQVADQYRNLLARGRTLEQDRPRNLTMREVKEISMRADFTRYRKVLEAAV